MTTDLGTTPRRRLTKAQRLKLFEDHGGVCVLCKLKIEFGVKWRDEHLRALGLGGSNSKANRAPVHIACAEAKDKDDIPAIAKAKRQKMISLGLARSSKPMAAERKVLKPVRQKIECKGEPAMARRYRKAADPARERK